MTAGPDKPPNLLLRTGFLSSAEMTMAFSVLIATTASAPPSSAALPSSDIDDVFGVSFAQTGTSTDELTAETIERTFLGSEPISAP